MELENASAVVTGGASGLGAATARLLASRGVRVVIADLNDDLGKNLASEIDATYIRTDVTEPDQVIEMVEAALSLAPLRAVVNCAGIPYVGRTIGRDGSYESAHGRDPFELLLRVNLWGTFNVVRLAASAMSRLEPLEDGARGAFVNTTSVAAFDGQVGQVAYSASKGGIVGMTLPLARDLAVVGIRLNTIAPGLIETPIYNTVEDPESFKAHLAKDVVFPRRLGQPSEYATLCYELLTNSYLNGEVIRLDAAVRLPPR